MRSACAVAGRWVVVVPVCCWLVLVFSFVCRGPRHCRATCAASDWCGAAEDVLYFTAGCSLLGWGLVCSREGGFRWLGVGCGLVGVSFVDGDASLRSRLVVLVWLDVLVRGLWWLWWLQACWGVAVFDFWFSAWARL